MKDIASVPPPTDTMPALHERVFVLFTDHEEPGVVTRIINRKLVQVKTESCVYACAASDLERGQLSLL